MHFATRLGIHLEPQLTESILDVYRQTLPLDVWDKDRPFYRLKPTVRDEILRRLFDFIPRELVKKVALVGSTASHLYNPTTDVDIHLITPLNPESPEFERYKKRSEAASHRPIPDTQRPVNFFIHKKDDDFAAAESVYDVLNDKWKKYTPMERVNIRDYYNIFKKVVAKLDVEKADLYRGLVDYVELKSALKDAPLSEISLLENELELKLREVNEIVDAMVAQYKVLKYNRTMAYIQQIKQGNLNRARELSSKGDANVVYKLLERYSYMELLKALKKFKKERGELSHADIKDMSKVVSTTLQQSIKDKLDAKLEEL